MQAAEIRSKFVEFFKANSHTHVASSSLVPQNDPTLLFTNAGMVQFKDVFLGNDKRNYTRATTHQKCVRAGGKHNDLENVGHTARHHTFFEMLGNFSFGDYFKQEAISLAWRFVTEVLKLPKDRLYVTVFRDDDEAADIWHNEQAVPRERIYRMGEKDNFWSMGDTGPCGPCTEIFYDLGSHVGCGKPTCAVGCDCDRFMEFWNLVFMQFNRDDKGNMTKLPKPSVDTGAGLERIAMIMQGTMTNYDTDLFKDIINDAAKLANGSYDPKSKEAVAYRVIADHARAATFLISDGVIPSNEGRGYVLRRIIRRAIRYGKNLGFEKAFLYQVCASVVRKMSVAYPELKDRQSFVQKCVQAEEEQFFRTLEHGLHILNDEMAKLKSGASLSGDISFRLYDTYGFPLDLTALILREKGFGVDEVGFSRAMEDQKNRSRKNWKGSGEKGLSPVYHQIVAQLRDKKQSIEFVGYEREQAEGECVALLDDSGEELKLVDSYSTFGSMVQAVFLKTPFYGESGGQVGDHGRVEAAGFGGEVVDVLKPLPELVVAHIRVDRGSIKVGSTYKQTVRASRRALTRRNHTATHLLHEALRRVLGDHVKQAGSLVNDEMLRFDFTHFQSLTTEELEQVETSINQQIWDAHPVSMQEMDKDAAVAAGAMAIFGEKYGDKVRVVKAGAHSVELCGGTHVNNTAEIQLFRVVSESAIASGVRRMIALTSKHAFEYLRDRDQEVKMVRDHLKATSYEEVEQRIVKLQDSEKKLRRELENVEAAALGSKVKQVVDQAPVVAGVKVVSYLMPADEKGVKALRDAADMFKSTAKDLVVFLGMDDPNQGKSFILAASQGSASAKVKANDLISAMAPQIEGRGGGKPDMAQAGGVKLGQMPGCLNAANEWIVSKLNS